MTMGTTSSPLQELLGSRFLVGKAIPDTGKALSAALNNALNAVTDAKTAADQVSATIDAPPNIALIQANLSGTQISLSPEKAKAAKQQVSSGPSDIKDRLPAMLHKLMVKAHPLVVDGIPAEFDLQVEDVPFEWITGRDGRVWIGANEANLDAMNGEFTARIEMPALKQAVKRVVAVGAQQNGFALQDMDFVVQQQGDVFLVDGYAKVKKSFISARATAKARVTYDPKAFKLTINQVAVDSANPAVAVVLRMMQGKIASFQGKTIDLNELLAGSGKTLTKATIDVTDRDVRVVGKFS